MPSQKRAYTFEVFYTVTVCNLSIFISVYISYIYKGWIVYIYLCIMHIKNASEIKVYYGNIVFLFVFLGKREE